MLTSVIMPTYNSLDILRYSLPAILEQTLDSQFNYEVVLIDDGSDLATKKFLKSIKDPKLKLVTLERNSGRSIARNRGIKASQGEVLVFLDSDVVADSHLVHEHLFSLGFSSSKSSAQRRVSSGRLINVHELADLGKANYKLKDFSAAHFATGNSAVHRKFLEEVQEDPAGPFDEKIFSIYGWEDLELGLRLEAKGMKYARSPKAFGYHYCPPLVLQKLSSLIEKEKQRAHTANLFFKKHPSMHVRLMTQKTLFHRILWELLSLGGLLNEKTLAPLMSYLLKNKKYGALEALARNTFLNLNYVRSL